MPLTLQERLLGMVQMMSLLLEVMEHCMRLLMVSFGRGNLLVTSIAKLPIRLHLVKNDPREAVERIAKGIRSRVDVGVINQDSHYFINVADVHLSAKAGFYASKYKKFGNLCYVIGALQAFMGHHNRDMRIKVQLAAAVSPAKGEYQMDYVPTPRVTEAAKSNDRKSLYRALDKKLYLLVFGKPFEATSDKPVWHFPEKVYDSEPTLRKCAESALKSALGDLTHTYFVGNAPMAHMAIQPTEETPDLPSYKRFLLQMQCSSSIEI